MTSRSFAIDSNQVFSVTITNGTPVAPRSIFTQTWIMTNCGTTTWSGSGYTFNLIGEDSLGAMPIITNTSSGTYHFPRCAIPGGKNVAPGGTTTFTCQFITPETSGSYTDYFQMNNTSGNFFGPTCTVQVAVSGGNTNQFDRARAVSYANNYAAYVCSDGTFWTNGGNYANFPIGVFTTAPVDTTGDDCAHFVSCCIGSTNVPGGGLKIPMRTPTYGEPGATKLVTACLINPGYAVEVSSFNQMEPGDVMGWNWEGNTSISNLDHVTLYLGNSLIAAHATSELDVGPNHYLGGSTVMHLIHIFDVPTLNSVQVGNKFVMSWTTNWNKYALYSASTPLGPWSKVTGFHIVGNKNYVTNTVPLAAPPEFFRLEMP